MNPLIFLGWFFAAGCALWALVEFAVALPRILRWCRRWFYRRPLDFVARKAGKRRDRWICRKLYAVAHGALWRSYGGMK